MDVDAIVARLEAFPAALEAVVGGLGPAEARWRPAEGGWSIVEVVNHLLYEEEKDFRARARSTVEAPEHDWAPIDPERAVVEGRFQDRDLRESLRRFRAERERSVEWLRTVAPDAWANERRHPKFGSMKAGDLLAAWGAHDARHLGQIAKRLHGLAARDGAPYSVEYAG